MKKTKPAAKPAKTAARPNKAARPERAASAAAKPAKASGRSSRKAASVAEATAPAVAVSEFATRLAQLKHVDESQLDAAKQRLDSLTKPRGSLGQLEWLAAKLALIQGSLQPRIRSAAMLIFAADHGAADAGLSAYPSAVTGRDRKSVV